MHPGFNHNIKYKGKIYHIQSEDSGVNNPHIITHLFVGGNIIDSMKVDYKRLLLNQSNFDTNIAELMKKQHKEMMRLLINGKMDAKLGLPVEEQGIMDDKAPAEVAELVGEQDDGELFLGVISEKSLDEVILSFLSDEETKNTH